jgi:uncharacterized protein (TIGR03083 family)
LPVDREWVFAAAADERRQIADLVAELDEAQLAEPSLCTGWDVKTVVAHLVSVVVDGTATFMWMALRRGSMDRGINELALRRAREPASQIVASLRGCADRRMSPPGAGPLDPLADVLVLVHGGDIRIPLGLPFKPDAERACAAVDFLTGPWRFAFVSRGLLKGLRFEGTDVERSWGEGAEIRGPVAALMMVAGGRTALLDTLDGPGVPTLRGRINARL